MSKIPTKVIYTKKLPLLSQLGEGKSSDDFLVIVDQKVVKQNPHVAQWLKVFRYTYKVKAGEDLKRAEEFPKHLRQIFKILGGNSHRGLTVIAIGGGSVGDFAGFVASIFKRGLDLIQIPSTWLAAIDSAHGGKNGLNLGSLKNQIGTFHHPQKVFVVRELLNSQPPTLLDDALGELIKMALLTPKPWGIDFLKLNKITLDSIWKYIPLAVAEKYRIVSLDPKETKGLRHFLNFGHTFGHVLELEQKLPHGRAVAIGLKVALKLSHEWGLLSPLHWEKLKTTPMLQYIENIPFQPLSETKFVGTLLQDKKKISAHRLQFVGLKSLGKPVLHSVTIEDLVSKGKKHGFIRSPRR